MQVYQPWDEAWRDQIVYITVPNDVEKPVDICSDFTYPIFIGAFEQKLRGEDFWRAVAGAMIYVMGHQPGHPQVQMYIYWLYSYNASIVTELIFDGTNQTAKCNLETAVWLFQAAVLLDPSVAEAHYNLGLAYYELGIPLAEKKFTSEGESCFRQAARYLENAVELNPNLGLAYFNLGYVYQRMGLDDESRKCLDRIVLSGSDHKPAHTGDHLHQN